MGAHCLEARYVVPAISHGAFAFCNLQSGIPLRALRRALNRRVTRPARAARLNDLCRQA